MGFFNTAYAAEVVSDSAAVTGQSSSGSMIILLVFMVALYFIVWRPQNKRAKEHRELVANLAKGDEIVTSSGIVGKITKMVDDFVIVDIAENVEIKLQKGAIANVLPKGMIKKIG